ncbi:Glycerol-3-phosphate acyltransferase [Dirofilaria immitis]
MEETDKSKILPKPISYELKRKKSAVMKLLSLLPYSSCSLISSETSFEINNERPLNGFEWQNCETKKEINKINMLSDFIGHDLKDDSVTSICDWLLSDKMTRMDSSAKLEIWTPFSDYRLKIAVTEAFNFQLKDYIFTPSTPSTDESTTESMAYDYKRIISIVSRSETISSSKDETETVFLDTQIIAMPTAMNETQQTYQLATSDKAIEVNMKRSTSNEKKFFWNPDAPPFVPRNLTHNYDIKSLPNHRLTLYNIETRDVSLPYRSSYVTVPWQMQNLALTYQQSSFGQIMPNIVASMINAASNLIGSQQMYSNANGTRYCTSMTTLTIIQQLYRLY